MKIYTKTGDKGMTGLLRGGRVSKDSTRVNAYGSVEELNTHIGWALAQRPAPPIQQWLRQVQKDLFTIGSDLAAPQEEAQPEDAMVRLPVSAQSFMEDAIDAMEAQLQPLQRFILPGGSPAAAALHVACAVCRRVERAVVSLNVSDPVNPAILVYLNRLSDLLFVMSRFQNNLEEAGETPWER